MMLTKCKESARLYQQCTIQKGPFKPSSQQLQPQQSMCAVVAVFNVDLQAYRSTHSVELEDCIFYTKLLSFATRLCQVEELSGE